jgi:hypothetical protein
MSAVSTQVTGHGGSAVQPWNNRSVQSISASVRSSGRPPGGNGFSGSSVASENNVMHYRNFMSSGEPKIARSDGLCVSSTILVQSSSRTARNSASTVSNTGSLRRYRSAISSFGSASPAASIFSIALFNFRLRRLRSPEVSSRRSLAHLGERRLLPLTRPPRSVRGSTESGGQGTFPISRPVAPMIWKRSLTA